MKLGGIVLCGGESRRMGASKAWLRFGPETMLQRVARLVGAVADPVVVVAAPGQEIPPLGPKTVLVRDAVPGRGPLQGMATGLEALPRSVEIVYISSCDAPLLRPEFIRFLADSLGESEVVAPQEGGFYHPLAGVYRPSVLPRVRALLDRGTRRLQTLLAGCDLRPMPLETLRSVDPDLGSLLNVNSPEAYREALARAGVDGG